MMKMTGTQTRYVLGHKQEREVYISRDIIHNSPFFNLALAGKKLRIDR